MPFVINLIPPLIHGSHPAKVGVIEGPFMGRMPNLSHHFRAYCSDITRNEEAEQSDVF